MSFDRTLLQLIADPVDKRELIWREAEGVFENPIAGRRYGLADGVPILLAGKALEADKPTVSDPVDHFDGQADWYDDVMQDPNVRAGLAQHAFRILVDLLGEDRGVALDIGCGTGIAADFLRAAGFNPVGVDLSADQLRVAAVRLPVIQGDAGRLPIRDEAVERAYSTFAITACPDIGAAAAEIYRVLKPGGRYVTVDVHPCFNGANVEFKPDGSALIRPGYIQSRYADADAFTGTIRGRLGGWHRPLADYFNAFAAAGLRTERIAEGGGKPLPEILAIALTRS